MLFITSVLVAVYTETASRFLDGGAEEDRTPDLRIANAALSQLSYGPTCSGSIPPLSGLADSFLAEAAA